MSQTEKYIQHDSRQHKTDEAEQYLEDRAQLLDTIREMINVEPVCRVEPITKNLHPKTNHENLPSYNGSKA